MRTDITAIMALRVPPSFRDEKWVEKCLKTLKRSILDIIVIDYGSTDRHKEWIVPLMLKHDITYKEIDGGYDWSNKTATNYALPLVETKYTLVTDIDCYYAPNFADTVMKYLQKRNHMVLGVPLDVFDGYDDPISHSKAGIGSCIAVETDWIRNNPFDENYKYWGLSDADLVLRAKKQFHAVTLSGKELGLYNRTHPRPKQKLIDHNKDHFSRKWGIDDTN